MSAEHEFQNGCKVRAMYDGFAKMYKRGDTAIVMDSGWMRGVLLLEIKIDSGKNMTVYASNWQVIQ